MSPEPTGQCVFIAGSGLSVCIMLASGSSQYKVTPCGCASAAIDGGFCEPEFTATGLLCGDSTDEYQSYEDDCDAPAPAGPCKHTS